MAKLAGVSEATVSLALSGSPRISDATRERVSAIADQLGYRPHAGARALRTDSTSALGLVISDVANPFFAELAGQIERSAAAQGYAVVLCNSDEDASRQDAYLSSLLAGSQVDGVILVPVEEMTPGIRAAGKSQARLVLLDRPIVVHGHGATARRLRETPVVRADATTALREVAELLVGLGHRRFGVIALPLHIEVGRQRRDLMVAALRGCGIPDADIAVVAGDFRQHSGQDAARALLATDPRPTAIIASDGPMAIGAMKAVRGAGLRIPDDVSLVGFDDAPWFDLLDPPLTTVAQPVNELASASVTAMLTLLAGKSADRNITPACRLVTRSSCAPPPHRKEHS
ncbi:MAG TPA: LacI family DNA-binding transcriptional regulator [Pseudonocardia sp.]|nr:LacI family DNA-binding transcriptional regulator [Pseudonocardia sp.]